MKTFGAIKNEMEKARKFHFGKADHFFSKHKYHLNQAQIFEKALGSVNDIDLAIETPPEYLYPKQAKAPKKAKNPARSMAAQPVMIKCAWCGNPFEKIHTRKYCSDSCAHKSWNKAYDDRKGKKQQIAEAGHDLQVPEDDTPF